MSSSSTMWNTRPKTEKWSDVRNALTVRRTLFIAVAGIVAVGALNQLRLGAQAQMAGTTPLAFEVASVKPNALREGVRLHSFPGNRFEATNVPLRDLIIVAYGESGQPLPDAQMAGGPTWIDADRFDVSAKVGAESTNAVAQKQLMLRTLLVQRFKLAVHHETRDRPMYALVRARKNGSLGPQLRHADVDCEALLASQPGQRDRCILYALPSGTLMLRGQTMSAFANALTRLLDRTVTDGTGLAGGYDADAQFDPEGLPGMLQLRPEERPANDVPSLDTMMKEQLGLKLESTRGPVDVLVIDHAEKPSED
jgi:uncharacterized protein (TIGR03435 family)